MAMIIDDPGGVGFRIKEVYALLAVQSDNDEGIVGMLGPTGWVPLVFADKAKLDRLRPKIVEMAKVGGRTLRMVKFTVREDLEVFEP